MKINIIEKFRTMGMKTTQDVSDRTRKVMTQMTGHTNKIGDRMKVVFNKPMDFTKHYKLSHSEVPKTAEEMAFLRQALEESEEFFFQHLTEKEKSRLIHAMEPFEVAKGTKVITQGDLGDYLYILQKGSISFWVDNKNVGSTDTPKSIFGELALLYDCPRAATVLADSDCKLYRVSQHSFRSIQAAHALEGTDENKEALRNTKIFEGLDDNYIDSLAGAMFQKKCKKGEVVLKKGEKTLGLYIIKDGQAKGTEIQIGETKYADLVLGPGRCFGEYALLNDLPGSVATVTALSSLTLWVLPKERFFRVLKGVNLTAMVDRTHAMKQLAVIPMFAYSDVDRIEIELMAQKFKNITIPKGSVIAKRGQSVTPQLYLIEQGSIQLKSKSEKIKTIGPSEMFGFGGETLILTNQLKKKQEEEGRLASAAEDNAGCQGLTTDAAIHMAEQNLKNNLVIAQHDVHVIGDEDVKARILTLKDISDILYDPLRLGKDYRRSANMNPNLTKEKLERVRLLGAGTFGQVWLTRDAKTNGAYAMKIQYKRELIDYNQADGVLREKRIMEKMHHPFVMSIVNAQQDTDCLYMMMELIQGGELRSQMRDDHKPFLDEDASKFYASCMLEGLSYMHRRYFIYRDLKGENVLIDKDGYCVIVDLGFAKYVPGKTFTFCGTPIFIAPEIVLNKGHDKSADIWSLGVLIYEMLFGTNPFFDYDDPNIDQKTLFKRIISGKFYFPHKSKVSDDAKDLIRKMLTVDVKERLGCCSARCDLDLREHNWFKDVDFGKLYRKEMKAPWVPKITSPFDGENFAEWEAEDKRNLKPLSKHEQDQFKKFC